MISNGASSKPADSALLVDFNPGKLEAAAQVWPELSFLNPFELKPTPTERFALVVSLLLTDIPRRAMQAVGLAFTVRANVGKSDLFLWNPYSMFHFAMAEVASVSGLTILTPEYPLPSKRSKIVCPEVIGQIYHLKDDEYTPIEIPHTFVRDDPILGIYLTMTTIQHEGWSAWAEQRQIRRIEDRLVAFGLEMAGRGVRTEFFLHYSERSEEALRKIPYEIRDLVNLSDSLNSLSSRQLCLSGASTVGFKLSSLGLAHAFVLTVAEGEVTPYVTWAKDQDNVLDVDASDAEWVASLTKCFPEAASEVLLPSPDW